MSNLYSFEFSSEKSRGPLWYIIAFSVIIWFVVWWIFTKQYWLVVISLLLPGVYFLVENNSSDKVIVNFTQLWIDISDTFYEYTKIDWFAFLYVRNKPVVLRLFLKTKLLNYIDLKVDSEQTIDLKQFIPNYLQEREKEEFSFWDKIITFFKL